MASICVVAGDPSGDAHAARLIHALKAQQPSLTFSGLGGPAMRAAGATLLDELTQTAAIGPFDALKHLGRYRAAARALDAHYTAHRPDLVILVDFGDFNLPVIAPLAKRHGLRVLYYISPQIWAWGRWRLRYVRRYVDHMIVFFPFEATLYERYGIPVTWVGHPLIETARPTMTREDAINRMGLNPWRRTVGLLPGSRDREIARHLPLMLAAARRIAWEMPGVQFLIPKAAGIAVERLQGAVSRARVDAQIVAQGTMADALQLMEAALVASGTATLEAALGGVPMAVVYRTSWPTYLAARVAVRLPHIALVNVVAGRGVVPEFIQHRATPQHLADAIVAWVRNDAGAREMKSRLQQIREQLGPPGAVERAARTVLAQLP